MIEFIDLNALELNAFMPPVTAGPLGEAAFLWARSEAYFSGEPFNFTLDEWNRKTGVTV